MNEELKPCPFCGGKAEFISQCVLECQGECCNVRTLGVQGKEEMIRVWNIRVSDQEATIKSLQDQIAAREEENEKLTACLEEICLPIESERYQGLACGVEDKMLQDDAYGAANYGFDEAMDYCASIAKGALPEEVEDLIEEGKTNE